MLKYFNIGIFLTTLGIISVTHANLDDFDEFNSFFQLGLGPMRSVGSENTLLKSSSFGDPLDKILSDVETALLKLKKALGRKQNNGETKMEDTRENELDSSPPSQYNSKRLSKPNSFKSPGTPIENNSKSKKQVPKKLEDMSSQKANELSLGPASDIEASLNTLFNSFGGSGLNGMSSQKEPSESAGKKLLSQNGNTKVYAVMPPEIEVQKNKHVSPLGLTEEKVNDIRQEVFQWTNYYRKRHGIEPLTLNYFMNNHAQEWANTLAPEHSIRHRSEEDNKLYGENIFACSPMENIGKVAVDSWYNELKNVRVGDGENELFTGPRGVVGHLTQLLWKKSRELGVGVARDGNDYVIVANYNPGGNVYKFFMENLPKFKQSDIDTAQTSHNELEKKLNTPRISVQRFSSGLQPSLSGRNLSFGNTPMGTSMQPLQSSSFRYPLRPF